MTNTNISEIISTWEVFGGWSVAPAGLDWIKEGYRIKVGANCTIGDECTFGNYCRFGNWCNLGAGCTFGDGCTFGNGCNLSADCRFGNRCRFGDGSNLGAGCHVHSDMHNPVDLGFVDSYRRVVGSVDGVAYVDGGCKRLSISEARKNWKGRDDRKKALAQLGYAVALAKINHWIIN